MGVIDMPPKEEQFIVVEYYYKSRGETMDDRRTYGKYFASEAAKESGLNFLARNIVEKDFTGDFYSFLVEDLTVVIVIGGKEIAEFEVSFRPTPDWAAEKLVKAIRDWAAEKVEK